MTITIRPAVSLERESIHQILVATAVFTQDEIDAAMELVDFSLRPSVKSEYTVQVIAGDASEGGLILGYVCYGPTPRAEGVFDLYWIAVDPARQGQGLGRLLLRFVEQEVRKLNGRMLLIETSSRRSNEPTIRFYRNSGYEEISRIKDFYRVRDDKVIFSRDL